MRDEQVRGEQRFRTLSETVRSVRFVEMPLQTKLYDEAIDLYRPARRSGVAMRSAVSQNVS